MLQAGGVLAVFIFLLIVWNLVLTGLLVFLLHKFFKAFSRGNQKDIVSALAKQSGKLKQNHKSLESQSKQLKTIEKHIKSHIQKLGFVRYNPFGNTGGDQSFCLSLLDELDNGIVITSLHTRDQTRLYTKQLEAGKPVDGGLLTREEKQSINKAKKKSK